jgi:hypothetical protein
LRVPGVTHGHLMVDDLHTLDLGCTARLNGVIMVRALRSGVFGNLTTEMGMQDGARALTRELKTWTQQQRRVSRTTQPPNKITLKMLQYNVSTDTGNLKSKGAESRALLPFAHSLAKRLEDPAGKMLCRASRAMLRAYDLMRHSDRNIDSDQLRRHFDKVFECSQAAGVKLLPKFHLMRHFPDVALRAGNPRNYSAYEDESQNRVIVSMCQACFTGDIEQRVLAREALRRALRSRGNLIASDVGPVDTDS